MAMLDTRDANVVARSVEGWLGNPVSRAALKIACSTGRNGGAHGCMERGSPARIPVPVRTHGKLRERFSVLPSLLAAIAHD